MRIYLSLVACFIVLFNLTTARLLASDDKTTLEVIPGYWDVAVFRYMGRQLSDKPRKQVSTYGRIVGGNYHSPKIRIEWPGTYRIRIYLHREATRAELVTNGDKSSWKESPFGVRGSVKVDSRTVRRLSGTVTEWTPWMLDTYLTREQAYTRSESPDEREWIDRIVLLDNHTQFNDHPPYGGVHYQPLTFKDVDVVIDEPGLLQFELADGFIRPYLTERRDSSRAYVSRNGRWRDIDDIEEYDPMEVRDAPIPIFSFRVLVNESILDDCVVYRDRLIDGTEAVDISEQALAHLDNPLVRRRVLRSHFERTLETLDLSIDILGGMRDDVEEAHRESLDTLLDALRGAHLLKKHDALRDWDFMAIAEDADEFLDDIAALSRSRQLTSSEVELLELLAASIDVDTSAPLSSEESSIVDKITNYLVKLEMEMTEALGELANLAAFLESMDDPLWGAAEELIFDESLTLSRRDVIAKRRIPVGQKTETVTRSYFDKTRVTITTTRPRSAPHPLIMR